MSDQREPRDDAATDGSTDLPAGIKVTQVADLHEAVRAALVTSADSYRF